MSTRLLQLLLSLCCAAASLVGGARRVPACRASSAAAQRAATAVSTATAPPPRTEGAGMPGLPKNEEGGFVFGADALQDVVDAGAQVADDHATGH